MSNLIHCDGPGCDRTASLDDEDRKAWTMVEHPAGVFDFHTDQCVANWAARLGVTITITALDPKAVQDEVARRVRHEVNGL